MRVEDVHAARGHRVVAQLGMHRDVVPHFLVPVVVRNVQNIVLYGRLQKSERTIIRIFVVFTDYNSHFWDTSILCIITFSMVYRFDG